MSRFRKILLAVTSLFVSCAKPGTPQANKPPENDSVCKDRDALSQRVLQILTERGFHQYNNLEIWLSHNYDPAYWEPVLNEAQSKINSTRLWVKSLPPGCVRDEYNQWLTYYYQHGLNDAREELRTHKTDIEQKKYTERNRQIFNKAAEIDDTIPTPPRR